MKYIDNDNTISTNGKEEENKNIENKENKENKKEPIIEEIDTTVPKNNMDENDDDNNDNLEKQNDENMIITGKSPRRATTPILYQCERSVMAGHEYA